MDRTSTKVTRTPWGGKLQALRTQDELPPPLDAAGWVGVHLRRLAELSLLATVVAVPGLYQLKLSPEAFQRVREQVDSPGFFMAQLQPYLDGMIPVLEAKFAVWFVLGMIMMAAYGAGRILEGLSGRPVFLHPVEGSDSSRAKPHRWIPLLAFTGYLIYSLFSFLFWAPELPPEVAERMGRTAAAVAAAESLADRMAISLGGGGFFFSLVAWLQVTFALFFFLVAEDLLRDRRFVYRILGLLLGMGILNAIIVLLLKVEFGPLMSVWVRFAEDDTRNQLGALIGHNTGMSSFLMAPLLIAATWLFSIQPAERPVGRAFLTGAVVLMVLALVLAQSRAILPILVLVGAGLGTLLVRRSCLRPRSRLYVWLPVALVFVVLTQIIPNRHNPLYREDVTLRERISEFTPQRLLTETRVRIATVSFSELIVERPLLGHGFGSFQYVYPKAQGEYFRENPRSRLAPTDRRTMRAHNEYLQALVEGGVIALVIALAGVFALMFHGWRTMGRTLMPHHMAIQAAIWWSALAILLHALVDFPLRVPPIALTLVLLLALISAADRLWLFPVNPPKLEAEILEEDRSLEGVRRGFSGLWRPAAALLVFLALLGAAGAAIATGLNRFVTSATLLQRGEAYLRGYYANPSREDLLHGAWADLREAKRTFWISGPVNRVHGQMQYFQAANFFDLGRENLQQGQEEVANANFSYALATAQAAISDLDMALAEERFNQLFHVRSSLFGLLAQHSSGEERERYARRSFEDLRTGVLMNPGDYEALSSFIVQIQDRPGSDELELIELMGILNHFHPGVFHERIISRVYDAVALAEHEEALRLLRPILEVRPSDPNLRGLHAAALRRTGQRARAETILRAALERSEAGPVRDFLQGVEFELAVGRGDLEAARRILDGFDEDSSLPEPLLATYRYHVQRQEDPDAPETGGLRARLLALGRRDPTYLQVAGVTLYTILDRPGDAVEWLERRHGLRPPQPPMDLQGLVILAKAYAALERWDDLEALLPEVRAARGGTRHAEFLARNIVRRLERRLEDSRRAGEPQ